MQMNIPQPQRPGAFFSSSESLCLSGSFSPPASKTKRKQNGVNAQYAVLSRNLFCFISLLYKGGNCSTGTRR